MSDSRSDKPTLVQEIEIPSVSHLAKIYRQSMTNADQPIANAAEAAAVKVAIAEGALAEALVIARFVDDAAA